MATNTTQDNIQLRVIIDGSPARKELAEVNASLVKLKETQKALVAEQKELNEARKAAKANGDTAEAQRLSKAIAENRKTLEGLNDSVKTAQSSQQALRNQIGDTALSFTELRMKAQGLQAALSRAVPDTPEARKLAAELYTLQQRMKEVGGAAGVQAQAWQHLRQGMKLTDMSMRQLELESQRLKTALHSTRPDTAAYANLHSELGRVDARMRVLRTGMGPFGQAWASIKSQMLGATAVLGAMFAGGAIFNQIKGMVSSSADLSDAMADVQRTTFMTNEEVRKMISEFKNLDTRTPRKELMDLAYDAGKLGIQGRDSVLEFVKAGDQLRVALGRDLGDDAVKNIGKLVDIFKLKQEFGLEQSLLKVGSTINELGIASTAAEGYMVEFLKRMGGIAPIAGITIDQTLALGATLDSLGQTSEVSSTALSKLFVKLGKDAARYAKLAGMSVEEFTDILKDNALEGFIAVLEGSKKTEGGVVALAESLGEMGIDAARAAGVFGVLANNTDQLRTQMGIANKAFTEGVSVTKEFNLKNETLAATLAKLQKEIYQTFITPGLTDVIQRWANAIRDLLGWIRRNSDTIKVFGQVLLGVITTMVTYKTTVFAITAATRASMALTAAWTTLKSLLTGQIARATAAQAAFNTVTKLNPIGLVLGLLSAAVVAMNAFGSATKEAAQAAATETTKLQILHSQILATNQGSEERRKLIEQLKAQYPQYLSHLDSDKLSNDELAKSIELVNQKLINKAILQSADKQLEEQNAKAAEAKMAQMEAERKLQELVALGYKQTGLAVKEGSLTAQAAYIQSMGLGKGLSTSLYNELNGTMRVVKAWGEEADAETAKSNVLLETRRDIMKRLGEDTEETAAKTEAAVRTLAQINAEIAKLEAQIANPGDRSDYTIAFIKDRIEALKQERTALYEMAEEAQGAARTLAVINEEIKNLKEQQDQTATTRTEFLAIEQKIEALEREKAAIEGVKKGRAKAAEDLTSIERAMAEFHERMYQATLGEDERELRQLEVKHAEELRILQEHQKKLIAAKKMTPGEAATNVDSLGDRQTAEYAALIENQDRRIFDSKFKLEQDIQQMMRESRSVELRDVLTHYDTLIRTAELNAKSTTELERERYNAVLKFREDELQNALAMEMAKWDELIRLAKAKGIDTTELENARGQAEKNIRKKWLDAQVADTEDAEQKMRAARVQSLRHFEGIASAFAGLVQSISQYMDAGVKAAEIRADADGVRTEEEIANIQRLEKQRRDAALVAIAVQGAAAIANGIASAMTLQPWPAAVAAAVSTAGIIMGLMAQARALMNTASSSSTNNSTGGSRPSLNSIPLGADGMAVGKGKVLQAKDGGGILGGNLHSQGGNTLYDDKTGNPIANVEKDELMLIMSRKATAANADLIPAMLEASRKGERLPIMQREMPMPNPTKVGQAMRVVHMAAGGVLTRGTALVNLPTNNDGGDSDSTTFDKERISNAELITVMKAVLTEARATRKAAERFPTELTATTSIVEGDRRRSEYDYMQKLNKGRKVA